MPIAGSHTLVGVIFLTSAIAKTRSPQDFVRAIEAYDIVRDSRHLHQFALSIMAVEFIVGISLLGGWLLPWSAIVSIVLLCGFTAVALLAGRAEIVCGCMVFGRNETIGRHIYLRNAALICLVLPTLLEGVSMWLLIGAFILFGGSVVSDPRRPEPTVSSATGSEEVTGRRVLVARELQKGE